MKKKIISLFLGLAAVLLVGLFSVKDEVYRFSDHMIELQEYKLIMNDRLEYDALITKLSFDEQELFFDNSTNTFYYSLIEGSSSAFDPQIQWESDIENTNLVFLNSKMSEEGLEANQTIAILAYSDKCYCRYYLKYTTLPLMNIECDETITKVAAPMEMVLFDNSKGATQRVTVSKGEIKVRGASSSRLPKTSYRISLTQESLGDNTRENHVSLLGMRKDDDWILYTPFNDPEKIRNVFNSNLWTETCGKNNSEGIQTGIEYKYFELFIDGEYWGLYALGYPIDDKLMGIDDNELLYKKVGWGSEIAFTVDRNATYGEFVKGFEVKTVDENDANDIYRKWRVLLEFYEQYYQHRYDDDMLLKMIDIDNAIDTYLFLSLIQGADNTRGTELRNMYIYMYNKEEVLSILYAPWDMDLTWGSFFSEEWDKNYVQPYYFSPHDELIMTAGPLNQLLLNEAPGILGKIFERYWELRAEGWSDEQVNELLDAYEDDIYISGAYRRELKRWPEATHSKPDEGLTAFREYVVERLHTLDEYYKELEANYMQGEYTLSLPSDYTFSASPVGCTDLKLYLTMLAFADYDISVEIKSTAIWNDMFYIELFEKLGMQYQTIVINPELQGDVHITLLDKNTMELVDDAYFVL